MAKLTSASMSRRSFLAATAVGAGAAAVCGVSGCSAPAPTDDTVEEKMTWTHCSPNCYGRCALRVFTREGQVVRIESDNTGDDAFGDHQIRACLRGRSGTARCGHTAIRWSGYS